MAAHRDEPNPLRPYYIPPSTVDLPQPSHHATPLSHLSSRSQIMKESTYGSSARNILSDVDYSEYLSDSSPSLSDVIRRLSEQAIWKYTSVFLAQPFEVVKTVLQVYVASTERQHTAEDLRSADDARRRYSRNLSRVYVFGFLARHITVLTCRG